MLASNAHALRVLQKEGFKRQPRKSQRTRSRDAKMKADDPYSSLRGFLRVPSRPSRSPFSKFNQVTPVDAGLPRLTYVDVFGFWQNEPTDSASCFGAQDSPPSLKSAKRTHRAESDCYSRPCGGFGGRAVRGTGNYCHHPLLARADHSRRGSDPRIRHVHPPPLVVRALRR